MRITLTGYAKCVHTPVRTVQMFQYVLTAQTGHPCLGRVVCQPARMATIQICRSARRAQMAAQYV